MLKSSHGLLYAEDLSHRICRFFLCCGGDMGIGIQRESGGEVAQHAGHGLDIHSVLQGYGSEGVAEVVESDLWDASSFQNSFEHIVYAVR